MGRLLSVVQCHRVLCVFSLHFYYYHYELQDNCLVSCPEHSGPWKRHSGSSIGLFTWFGRPVAIVKSITCLAGFAKTKRARVKSSKHGLTTLVITGLDPPRDITIYIDVSLNPGPTLRFIESFEQKDEATLHINWKAKLTPRCLQTLHTNERICYSREQLMEFRRHSTIHYINSDLLSVVKENKLFRFRGKRGEDRKIATKISLREHTNNNCFNMDCSRRSCSNLIIVPRSPFPVNNVFFKGC